MGLGGWGECNLAYPALIHPVVHLHLCDLFCSKRALGSKMAPSVLQSTLKHLFGKDTGTLSQSPHILLLVILQRNWKPPFACKIARGNAEGNSETICRLSFSQFFSCPPKSRDHFFTFLIKALNRPKGTSPRIHLFKHPISNPVQLDISRNPRSKAGRQEPGLSFDPQELIFMLPLNLDIQFSCYGAIDRLLLLHEFS